MSEEPSARRQRSLHCKPEEQAMIRERAAAANKTISRYVLDLALDDDPGRHSLVLSADEPAEAENDGGDISTDVLVLQDDIMKRWSPHVSPLGDFHPFEARKQLREIRGWTSPTSTRMAS